MAKMPASDTTLQSTKQMLDELDALMEQMLSMPVHDVDELPRFPKDVVKQQALTATLTLLESPAPLGEPITPAPKQHPPLNAPHTMPSALAPLTNDAAPVSLLPQVEPMLAAMPESDADPTTLWCYWPLLWMNMIFDGSTTMLGEFGARLRTPASRSLLGVLGIASLVVAAGWFVRDWLGWNW
jgi:hypothetical protein